MSQENVELVRAVFDAWNRRDMKTLRDVYDPGVIGRPPENWPESGPFVGVDEMIRQGEQVRETWDAVRLEPTSDFIDIGDRVAVRHVWRSVGHGPEALDLDLTVICTIRKRKIIGLDYFWDHAEALEAMGLSEQDAHADS